MAGLQKSPSLWDMKKSDLFDISILILLFSLPNTLISIYEFQNSSRIPNTIKNPLPTKNRPWIKSDTIKLAITSNITVVYIYMYLCIVEIK